MQQFLNLILLIGLSRSLVGAEFNTTKCPHFWEMQSDKVKQHFDIDMMVGTYYELAYQDITQYPACNEKQGLPHCVQSIKEHFPVENPPDAYGSYGLITDTWTFQCARIPFEIPLRFNVTEHPGYFLGFTLTKIGSEEIWPDTVIDYKISKDGTHYEWIIELQCQDQDDYEINGQDEIKFTAINFYARHYNVTEAYLEEIYQAARNAGIGVFMDYKFGMQETIFENCRDEKFEQGQELYDIYEEPDIYGSTSSTTLNVLMLASGYIFK